MFERYSDPAQGIVATASEEARQLGHNHIGTEHLLLGLLSDDVNPVTRALPAGTTVQVVRHKVSEAVGSNSTATDDDLSLTPRAKRALERATRFSLQRHDDEVGNIHVLLGVLDVEGRAGQVLRGLGIDMGRLREAAERTPDKRELAPPPASVPARSEASATDSGGVQRPSPRCSECGTALDTALAWSELAVKGEDGERRRFLIVYCSACGSSMGAVPAQEASR